MHRRHILLRPTAWIGAHAVAGASLISNDARIDQIPPLAAIYTSAADDVLNVKDLGAPGTGKSHPASERFATIEACRRIFPKATALSQELDFLAIQLAIDRAEVVGHGIVLIPPGGYLLSPPGLRCTSAKVRILGAGSRSSLLLCGNCSTSPALSFTCPQLESGDGVIALANIGFLGFNEGIRIGGTQTAKGVAHTSFREGSRGLLLINIISVNITSVAFYNFDLPTDVDSQTGNVWDIRYDSCMFSANNKGIVINQLAPNAFEHMAWQNCISANNNFGVFVNFTDLDQVGGTGQAGDVYLSGCSLDYNILWTIYYLGGAKAGDDIQSVLYVGDSHLETSSHASADRPRIFNDGNLIMRSCMGYESAGNPVGWITGTFFSRTSVQGCMVPGTGEHGIPLFHVTEATNGTVSGSGNVNRYGGDIILMKGPMGCRMESANQGASFVKSGPVKTDFARQNKTTLLTGDIQPAEIQIVADEFVDHAVGAVLNFLCTDASVWTLKPDPGVTLHAEGSKRSIGGAAGCQMGLRKIAPNVWLAYGTLWPVSP